MRLYVIVTAIVTALLFPLVTAAQDKTAAGKLFPLEGSPGTIVDLTSIRHINDIVYHRANAFTIPRGFRTTGTVVAVQREQDDENLVQSSTRGAALTIGRRYLGTIVLRDPTDSSKQLACFVGVSAHDPEMLPVGVNAGSPAVVQAWTADASRKDKALASLQAGSVVTVTGWDAMSDPTRGVQLYGCDFSVGGRLEAPTVSAGKSASLLESERLRDYTGGNGEAFEQRYDGKTLIITGRVSMVGSIDQLGDGNRTPTLSLATGGTWQGVPAYVTCIMAPGATITGLRGGSQVTIQGRYRHADLPMFTMDFRDCTVVHGL